MRELGYLKVDVAGGSVRTLMGNWSLGCYQNAFRNYTLSYKPGYDFSQHECVFCDYVPGPFIIRRALIKGKTNFNSQLPQHLIFQDFFLKLRQGAMQSIVCPDSMFYISESTTRYNTNAHWRPLAKEWKIDRIRTPSGVLLKYTCVESNVPCNKEKGYAVPPCCLQSLADYVKLFMENCERIGALCELQEGTLLGAVKFNKVLPWERDADLTFHSANYSALEKLVPVFAKAGFTLKPAGALWCCVDNRTAGGKMGGSAPGWSVELYGQHIMTSEILVSRGMKPTKVLFDGTWVNVPTNPGLYVRNRYGREVYKHAQHWLETNKNSGWDTYQPSTFSKCAKENHHACLDQYMADGNLQFEEPSP